MNWGEKQEKRVSLSLFRKPQRLSEYTTLYWTCWSADGKMTTSRLKSEANIIDLGFFFLLSAGMKTAKGVMRLRKNKMKIPLFPHICGANMQP